ncbi:MAG: VWA domain-containing protein, partial [Myxococcota bacterium]
GDIDAVYAELFGFRAEGGGDTPESVNQALHEAITRSGWSQGEGVYRVVFLVGDAPPHMDYQEDVAYPETLRLAQDRGIVVNTIQCGELASTRGVWQEIARVGSGQFVSIAQDGAMVALHSPMDEKLATLNRSLADTVVVWGDEDEKKELRRKLESTLAAPAPVAASRLGYLAKSGGRVNSGRHDLLDALDEGLVALGSVAAERLPREMQAMDAPEREAWVEEQRARRKQLQGEISTLSQERDEWMRAETERLASEGRADGFDQEVLKAVRSQAAEKGIVYE